VSVPGRRSSVARQHANLGLTALSNRQFAITYTVKNEASLLPDAVAYHLALGCARIYIFFDGTTDNSREAMQGGDRIVCAESVKPVSLADAPMWIEQIMPRWQESMDVRKRINTFVASRLAREEGIEWLINIDPDELLLLNDGTEEAGGPVDEFFSGIAPDVDQILLPNLEAIAVGEGTGRPFVDCTLFLRRYPLTELLWRYSSASVRRLVSSPKVHAWYDHWFYRLRLRGALPRLMRHPVTGESIPAGYFLGYSNHKSFIRTRVAEEFLFNIHKWQKVRRHPKSIRRGNLLHYDLCDADYYCAKFRQRQPAVVVKAFFCRHAFAQIARDLPIDTARQFFLENLCIRDTAILRRLQRRGIVKEIRSVARFVIGQP
jgi:hypothetical protein